MLEKQENENIGKVIAGAREKAGLSQRQLAKVASISNAELSKIESGEREIPNPKTLRKITKFIDLNYNDLMYMIGLGVQVSPLNKYLLNHYVNLKGQELNDAWTIAKASIQNNEIIIKALQNRIDSEELGETDRNVLLETIEDLKYQNNTNSEIIKLLESNIVKENLKNANRKNN